MPFLHGVGLRKRNFDDWPSLTTTPRPLLMGSSPKVEAGALDGKRTLKLFSDSDFSGGGFGFQGAGGAVAQGGIMWYAILWRLISDDTGVGLTPRSSLTEFFLGSTGGPVAVRHVRETSSFDVEVTSDGAFPAWDTYTIPVVFGEWTLTSGYSRLENAVGGEYAFSWQGEQGTQIEVPVTAVARANDQSHWFANVMRAQAGMTVEIATVVAASGYPAPNPSGEPTFAEMQQVEGFIADRWGKLGLLRPSHPYKAGGHGLALGTLQASIPTVFSVHDAHQAFG